MCRPDYRKEWRTCSTLSQGPGRGAAAGLGGAPASEASLSPHGLAPWPAPFTAL